MVAVAAPALDAVDAVDPVNETGAPEAEARPTESDHDIAVEPDLDEQLVAVEEALTAIDEVGVEPAVEPADEHAVAHHAAEAIDQGALEPSVEHGVAEAVDESAMAPIDEQEQAAVDSVAIEADADGPAILAWRRGDGFRCHTCCSVHYEWWTIGLVHWCFAGVGLRCIRHHAVHVAAWCSVKRARGIHGRRTGTGPANCRSALVPS